MKLLLLIALAGIVGIARAADAPVPMPKSTALASNPQPGPGTGILGLVSRGFVPIDLAKYGYAEEDYIIAGNANVYDWARDGTLSIRASGPYATRVLVRRPKDPAKFSGTVVVELSIYGRGFDWPMMWGYMKDAILERGDAWVGITMPGAAAGLVKYNPTRYAGIAFKNPAPGGCPKANPTVESGLAYDMISQVGVALRNGAQGYPLAGYNVRDVLMTSQLGELSVYIKAVHGHAKLADGKPVYDGYLVKALGTQIPAQKINQCADPQKLSDLGFITRDIGVPIIGVLPQADVVEAYQARRPDSDTPGDRFRSYEIAGAQHSTRSGYDAIPQISDQSATGATPQGTPDWPYAARCTPEIQLNTSPLLDYSLHSALYNLDAWVKKGIAPPKADRIKVNNGDTGSKPEVALDQYGNALGGVRTYFVDVPAATYYMTSTGPGGGCREVGHTVAFDWGKLDSIYGSYKNYAAKVNQSVDKSVKAHYLSEPDGRKIKAELKSATESAALR